MRKFMFTMMLLSVLIVAPCYGDIEYTFSGSITRVDQFGSASLTGTFHVGDPVSGTATYNPAAINSGTATGGLYTNSDGLTINADGYTLVTNPTAGVLPGTAGNLLQVDNDNYIPPSIFTGFKAYLFDELQFDAVSTQTFPSLNIGPDIALEILFGQFEPDPGPTPDLFTSTGVTLPFSIDISKAQPGSAYGFFQDEGNHSEVDFSITKFTPTAIPEPATFGLVGIGLIGLGIVRIHQSYRV